MGDDLAMTVSTCEMTVSIWDVLSLWSCREPYAMASATSCRGVTTGVVNVKVRWCKSTFVEACVQSAWFPRFIKLRGTIPSALRKGGKSN